MRILTCIFSLLIGCATTKVDSPLLVSQPESADRIDTRFIPILDSFIYEANIRGHLVVKDKLSVHYGNIRENSNDRTVGVCESYPDGRMVINIHAPYWDKANEYQREALGFHELGHCLIGLDHCKAMNDVGPVSIMYPQVLNTSYYKSHREDLVDELFNVDIKCIGDDDSPDASDGGSCSRTYPNDQIEEGIRECS